MRARFGFHLSLPIVFFLLAFALACSKSGDIPPGALAPTPAATSSVQTAKPLTAGDRMAIDEFVKQQEVIGQEWDQFYQEFDDWRAGLTSCHRSSAEEALHIFAVAFNSVTEQARNLPRTSTTRELADILIAAAEEEEAAFRKLRDRWQPNNVSFFEQVEQRRTEAARAQKRVEDLALDLQKNFEEGPTPEEVEAVEEFSEAFDFIKDAWGKFHDAYIALRKEEDSLDSVALIARYGQIIEESNDIVTTIAELPPTEATESMIDTLQEAAEAELTALINLTEALVALTHTSPAPTLAADSETKEPTTSSPSELETGSQIGLLLDEMDAALNESESALKKVTQIIKEIVDDDPAENLADVEEFNRHYKRLLLEWATFHERYNDWRKTEGGCDRVEVFQALDLFNQRIGELGRKVRDLHQSGFLLPMYTLLVEAAERDEGAMRALYNSWRPFTVDAFKAVDQERVNSDRLRRQANIGLQELRNRP